MIQCSFGGPLTRPHHPTAICQNPVGGFRVFKGLQHVAVSASAVHRERAQNALPLVVSLPIHTHVFLDSLHIGLSQWAVTPV
jgi:hypothetical protein